jgi:rhamnogalacturonan endolyase
VDRDEMAIAVVFLAFSAVIQTCLAAFGVTTAGNSFRVDTDGGLVFDVNKYEPILFCLTTKLTGNRNNADITSLVYKGTQYQASDKGTHINSGLGYAH